MSQQVYASPQDAVGKRFIDQRVGVLEAMVLPGPGAAGKMAFYNGAGDLTDANISVTGVANDLTFDNNTTLFVDNIQSTDGDLNLGGGVTNLITLVSSNAITIDATTSVTIGHAGFTTTIVDRLDVQNIDTSVIDSSGTLIVGPTAPNIVIGQVGADVDIVDGAPFFVEAINHATALIIGATTPDVTVDAINTLTLGHAGLPVVIDDSVQVDNIDTDSIESTSGTLTIGNTTPIIDFGRATFGGVINVPLNCIFTCSQIDASGSTFLYNSSASLLIGAPVGTTAFNDKIVFNKPFATTLDFYADQFNANVTGTGPDVSQIIGDLALSKVGPVVTIAFRWTVAPIVTVPATAIITFDVAIDAIYRPTTGPVNEICRVYVNAAPSQGKFNVDNAGVLTLMPSIGGVWTVGQTASADSVTLIYNVNM